MIYSKTLAYAGVPTIRLENARAGDAVFCHSAGLVGAAIRLGQKIRGFGKFATWNHVAWLDEPITENGKVVDWRVGQSIGRGVDNTHLLSEIAPGGEYEILSLDDFPRILGDTTWEPQRATVLATLRGQVGVKYGFLTIASIVVNILTPHWVRFDFRRANTWICSGLYGYALLTGGGLIDGDVYQQFPAELAQSA